ncbi:MAG: hypothetical protein JJT82_01530 [Legionellaceae bacterium]|nr:hypothetical protein [Legionellaceae bacterium]
MVVAADELMAEPLLTYGKRWEIECLFTCLKSKGFNFADTHITKLERIEKLYAWLTMAFCWAYKTDKWRNEPKEINVKKHGRKAISYFRYGLNTLRDLVLNSPTSVGYIARTVSRCP